MRGEGVGSGEDLSHYGADSPFPEGTRYLAGHGARVTHKMRTSRVI